MRHKKKLFTIILLSCFVLFLFLFIKYNTADHVVVNEVYFVNNEKQDWVEIYNPTLQNLSLNGHYLSDTKQEYTRYQIPDGIIIPAKGFVVFYGENHNQETESNTLNFSISNGETIYLSVQNTMIDSLLALSDEENEDDSVGYFPDGTFKIFKLGIPTPGSSNIKERL